MPLDEIKYFVFYFVHCVMKKRDYALFYCDTLISFDRYIESTTPFRISFTRSLYPFSVTAVHKNENISKYVFRTLQMLLLRNRWAVNGRIASHLNAIFTCLFTNHIVLFIFGRIVCERDGAMNVGPLIEILELIRYV